MDLIIYHNACPDGWAAAFICLMKYPNAELLPLNHGLNESQLSEVFERAFQKDVIMVDYSLRTRELNDQLDRVAKSFRILDHHKTAEAALAGADYATFDMARSGAGLAWDYLFGKGSDLPETGTNPGWGGIVKGLFRPWWVDYTEDRDLWNWNLPDSKEVNAFLMVSPRDPDGWYEEVCKTPIQDAKEKGRGVLQYIDYYVRSVIAEVQEGVLEFEGRNYRTGVLNIPYVGVSDACGALVEKGFEIGLAWFERGDGVTQFSLRSVGDTDVSAIAKSFKGGGHKNAAGFQVSTEHARVIIDKILGRK